MTAKQASIAGVLLFAGALLLFRQSASAEMAQDRVVRLAELEIDPAQLDRYKAALREEIETSIRIEPGVLTLYAVSVKEEPSQIRLFEVYANREAYQAHLRSPHFLKYKRETAGMAKSLRLIETTPFLLGAKRALPGAATR